MPRLTRLRARTVLPLCLACTSSCDWDSKADLDDSALAEVGPDEACNVIRHDTVGDAPAKEVKGSENDAAKVMNTADRSLAVGSGLRGIRALRKR